MSDRDISYYNKEQRRQQYQITSVPVEETFSEVLRNREKAMDSANSVDTMAERTSDANGAAKRAEKKFNTMMDMMS